MRPIDADAITERVRWRLRENPHEDARARMFHQTEHESFLILISSMPTIAPPPNDPLTLEQLREMNGEPIWTVTLGVEGSGRWELCTCELVTACPAHKVLRCVTAVGEITDYEVDTYGATWLAYRRKPEEGRHDD